MKYILDTFHEVLEQRSPEIPTIIFKLVGPTVREFSHGQKVIYILQSVLKNVVK